MKDDFKYTYYTPSFKLPKEIYDELFKLSNKNKENNFKFQGFPIAKYDEESKRVYIEYADGKIEYITSKNKQ